MIHELENLVRAGQFQKALALLKETRISEIPRGERLAFANIAGRLGQLTTALRILNPVIRGPDPQSASVEEKLQYANSLRKLGAVDEAIEIITGIQPRPPKALQHLAFCYQSQWQYKKAIPLLEEIADSPELEAYTQLVVKVNLLAAYVNEGAKEASALSNDLLSKLENSPSRLLYGNVLELSAQLDIQANHFTGVFEKLEKARALLSEAQGSASTIFIEKWIAIGQSLQTGKVTPELLALRQKAALQGHWETVRDCDFYQAKLTNDHSMLSKLYFGTPHADYRERIVKLGYAVPTSWQFAEGSEAKQILDLRTGTFSTGEFAFEPGQALHRLAIVLSQDLYRPFPLLALFSRLFPGEHFNPDTSPNRVYQILKRFRKLEIGLAAQESDGSYGLKLGNGTAILLPQTSLPLDTEELRFLKLRASLKQEVFTTEDTCEVMDISRSSAQRLLKWAEENRKVSVESARPGKGRFKFAA